jgi:CheY-like chemotaxis protein
MQVAILCAMHAESGRRADRPRILVVEDNDDFRLLLELTLREQGYTVDSVGCAEDALSFLDASVYDLVLCDYSLPGRSGTWLLSQLKQRHQPTGTLAAIITADPEAPGLPDDAPVISKRVNVDDLLSEVGQMVAGTTRPPRPRRHRFPIPGSPASLPASA